MTDTTTPESQTPNQSADGGGTPSPPASPPRVAESKGDAAPSPQQQPPAPTPAASPQTPASSPALTPPSPPGTKDLNEEPPDPEESARLGRSTSRSAGLVMAHSLTGAGYNAGTINISHNYDSSSGRSEIFRSFEDDLTLIAEPPPPNRPVAPDLVERYAAVLLEKRMVVIEHGMATRPAAVSAMRSVLACVRRQDPNRPLYTSGFNSMFPLNSFFGVSEWPERFRKSVIYLERSNDANASSFVGDANKIRILTDRLKASDAHLVMTVCRSRTSPATATGQSDPERCWVIHASESDGSADLPTDSLDTFEIAVLLCASIFPGLGVSEFVKIVNMLLSSGGLPDDNTKVAAISKDPTPRGDGAVMQTREQRWRCGERDVVLGEVGIGFTLPPDGVASEFGSNDAGFFLADNDKRKSMLFVGLARFPVLLAQHVDALTAHFFSSEASSRFRTGHLFLLHRLDALSIHRLTAEWLLRHFRSLAEEELRVECSFYFADLLLSAQHGANGRALIEAVIDGLVHHLLEHERDLFRALPAEMVANAITAALHASSNNDASEAFWGSLWTAETARRLIEVAVPHILLATEVLVILSRYLPADVIQAVRRILAHDALAGTSWPLTGDTENPRFARLPRLQFQWVLEQAVQQDPARWSDFSQAVADAQVDLSRPKARSRNEKSGPSSFGETATPSRISRSLAMDCLSALTSILSGTLPEPLPDVVYEVLFSSDRQAATGRTLSKLIGGVLANGTAPKAGGNDRGNETLDSAFVVWLYRSLTAAMLSRKGSSPDAVAPSIFALVAPLRASMSGAQRLAIGDRMREVQQRFFRRREYFDGIGARDQVRTENKRIQAMHIVIRAFSGAQPMVKT